MTTYLLTFALLLASDDKAPRKPSIIAPSLMQLTREEEQRLDEIIDRFMLADTKKLTGAAARKAIKDFEALGLDAVPALIRGLNRAAKIDHSCPVLMIGKKLDGLLSRSSDGKLLEFARDEIGAGVGRTKHTAALQNLRLKVTLRRNALARLPVAPRVPGKATTSELVKSASVARGAALVPVVRELAKREGKEVLGAIALVASSYDAKERQAGREALETYLGRQSVSTVRDYLTDADAEVRRAARRVGWTRHAVELLPDLVAAVMPAGW